MKKRPLAVVTMAYNEAVMLPIWLRHYKRQVGSENCYVIDHGSSDGSTANIDASVIRLPRTPMNEVDRVSTVRDFCFSLFLGFEYVLYVDADELVVPDPERAENLVAYMRSRDLPPVIDLFGTDVRHADGEADIDLASPVSIQRRYTRPISTLCKPTLVAERVGWFSGFHCLTRPHRPTFHDLYLFHLAHCDNTILYNRQKKRNASAPVDIWTHHQLKPQDMLDHMTEQGTNLPRRIVDLRHGEPHFEATKKLFADMIEQKDWAETPDLWQLPKRFVGLF